MKIWVIGRGYPTPENRMWGSFELEQAKLLARCGHEVSYLALTLSFFSRRDPRGLRTFEDDGVRVYACSHFYFPGKAGVYWESFEDRLWRTLLETAEAASGLPDLIHIHYPSMISSINEIERYRCRGVKLFVTEHWSRVLINNLKKHEVARLRYYAQNAGCFACVSEALQSAVRERVDVAVPMEVIPNIVSPLFFEADRAPHEGFTFVTVGRLVPLKQFDAVIREFLKAFEGSETVRLRLVGGGQERGRLESAAADHPQISFAGERSLADTARELAAADALVSFSRYETFSAPVAEAWACGKPVIVSAASGIAAYVTPENGRVVDANAPDELGAAMRELYDHHAAFHAETISAYAKRHFNDQAVMRQLEAMYTNH